ncbi:helix-turn-helix domain-containing protein [Cohnella nanjingensis]|uniref:Helix-turn-helix domain-containing protein n=1 Tax=Cohnella nanjingensis TaxID=1387779 RepID=A0A7X0RRV3_9BACL|nr:helix-turn-helix domain-containing protein [Cohnella nanjingensis]MBB6672513.1 helix-turn-helix domain-containing protein [Cohnella nanjingensis]
MGRRERGYPGRPSGDGSGRVIADHFQESDAYEVSRPEGMADWIMIYTLSGEGFIETAEGGERRLRAGDIAVVKGGHPHRYGTPKGQIWHFLWAHFVPGEQAYRWSGLPEASPGLVLHSVAYAQLRKRILRAFRRVLQDSRQSSVYANLLSMNALQEILLLLEQQHAQAPIDARVAEALDHLSARMKEPLQVGELARVVGLSASRLSHLFKEQTGASIIDTLNRMRLRQAALLLVHTSRSAEDAAGDVGFNHYNHFAALFKAEYGMSPSAFRKEGREEARGGRGMGL